MEASVIIMYQRKHSQNSGYFSPVFTDCYKKNILFLMSCFIGPTAHLDGDRKVMAMTSSQREGGRGQRLAVGRSEPLCDITKL